MVPLSRRALTAFLLASAILLPRITFAAGAEVQLRASWTKGTEHRLVHIQVARAGFFIAPNSPAFDNDRLIQVTDAVTRQPVPFRLRHQKQGMVRSIDLAFPQLQKPINIVVTVSGLVVVDQTSHRVAYRQSLTVNAPPAMAGEDRRCDWPMVECSSATNAIQSPSTVSIRAAAVTVS